MVTDSHIPADRNGLNFCVSTREISRHDETAISNARGRAPGSGSSDLREDPVPAQAYLARYVTGFGPQALAGLRVGV
jgi:phosphomannomutase